MKHLMIALFTAQAAPAFAEGTMTLKEFEAYVTGRTFTFSVTGEAAYGIEAYGPNRQVIWAELDNICFDGYYYAGENNDICFYYPELGDENCVQFSKVSRGLEGLGWDGTPYEARETGQTVPCVAPLLGS